MQTNTSHGGNACHGFSLLHTGRVTHHIFSELLQFLYQKGSTSNIFVIPKCFLAYCGFRRKNIAKVLINVFFF